MRRTSSGTSIAVVCMLRGVNVGARRIKMDSLRGLCASLDLDGAQTYIQSGNIVFRSPHGKLGAVAARLEQEIESLFGFHSDAIFRSAEEMRAVIAANPFARRTDVAGNRLLVTFLREEPSAESRNKALALADRVRGPEELHFSGRELFIFFPEGMGRSKLPVPAIEKQMATPGTARNWNTVVKLLEMAEALENVRGGVSP